MSMINQIRDALLRAKDDKDKCLGPKGVYTHYVYELDSPRFGKVRDTGSYHYIRPVKEATIKKALLSTWGYDDPQVKVVSIVITHTTPSNYRVFQSDIPRRRS
jgi:hypothetical protein